MTDLLKELQRRILLRVEAEQFVLDGLVEQTQRSYVAGKVAGFLEAIGKLQELSVEPASLAAQQDARDAVNAALFEPRESDAYDNLWGALIDIERYRELGKPADDVCIRTIKRVMGQIANAKRCLEQ